MRPHFSLLAPQGKPVRAYRWEEQGTNPKCQYVSGESIPYILGFPDAWLEKILRLLPWKSYHTSPRSRTLYMFMQHFWETYVHLQDQDFIIATFRLFPLCLQLLHFLFYLDINLLRWLTSKIVLK